MDEAVRSLIVEGIDDIHFLLHLLKQHGIEMSPIVSSLKRKAYIVRCEEIDIEIRELGGFNEIVAKISTEIKPGTSGVAIVADYDRAEDGRWRSLREKLESYYSNLPQGLPAEGMVFKQEKSPPLGVWLMPDNHSAGMMEDLAGRMVPDENDGWQHARDVVNGLPAGARQFPDVGRSKALIHTWLAWQEEPGGSIGLAITRRLLSAHQPDAIAFVTWLKRWIEATKTE